MLTSHSQAWDSPVQYGSFLPGEVTVRPLHDPGGNVGSHSWAQHNALSDVAANRLSPSGGVMGTQGAAEITQTSG